MNHATRALPRSAAVLATPPLPFVHGPSAARHAQWLAEVVALASDTRARRVARVEAAARAGCSAVHVTSAGTVGATLCGASHVELASAAAEQGLLYGVVPIGPRQLSASEPWADYFLVEAREPIGLDLARELGRAGKPVFVRVDGSDAPRGMLAVDTLVEAGCRRLVVLATTSVGSDLVAAGLDELRRETGLAVGWSEPFTDSGRVARAHRTMGVRHVLVRVELEGEAHDAFEPSGVAALRRSLEELPRAVAWI